MTMHIRILDFYC